MERYDKNSGVKTEGKGVTEAESVDTEPLFAESRLSESWHLTGETDSLLAAAASFSWFNFLLIYAREMNS